VVPRKEVRLEEDLNEKKSSVVNALSKLRGSPNSTGIEDLTKAEMSAPTKAATKI